MEIITEYWHQIIVLVGAIVVAVRLQSEVHSLRKDIEEIKNTNKKKIFFKSNKFLIHEGKAYPNKMSVAVNQPISSFDHPFCQIIDHRDFWEDKEHFYFVEKK